jgi:hypothetical protein
VPALLRPVVAGLVAATLHEIEHADHSFHVPVRSGRTDADVLGELLGVFAEWVEDRCAGTP